MAAAEEKAEAAKAAQGQQGLVRFLPEWMQYAIILPFVYFSLARWFLQARSRAAVEEAERLKAVTAEVTRRRVQAQEEVCEWVGGLGGGAGLTLMTVGRRIELAWAWGADPHPSIERTIPYHGRRRPPAGRRSRRRARRWRRPARRRRPRPRRR